MPLCAKCHQNEATVHFTTVVDGTQEETVHLCKSCAPPTGLQNLDPKELAALAITGKPCEFCGRDAFSGVTGARSTIYWCFDCGLEFSRILIDLWMSERPDLMRRSQEASSFLSICCDPELQAWSEAANQRVVQMLRERRQQAGRDKNSP